MLADDPGSRPGRRATAGARLLLGCHAVPPDAEFLDRVAELEPAGVVWVGHGIGSAGRLAEANGILREAVGRPFLIALDHEGGIVTRFSRGVTLFPGNRALGEADDLELSRLQGRVMGRELRQIGVDLNLAPVLDRLVPGRPSPGITIRSFGFDPGRIGRLGGAFLEGMQSEGVAGCAKHFPGIGAALCDPHEDLPVVDLEPKELFTDHLEPFRQVLGTVDVASVMTSHVLYPGLDPSNPATFSSEVVEGLLRGRLGYDGVVLSDDLEMGALDGFGSVGERAVRCARAGHDLLLVCLRPQAQREAHRALQSALEQGRLDAEASLRSEGRIARLGTRTFLPDPSPLPDDLPTRIAERSVRILADPDSRLPLPDSFRERLLVLYPDLRRRDEMSPFEPGLRDGRVLLECLESACKDFDLLLYPLDSQATRWCGDHAEIVARASGLLLVVHALDRFEGGRLLLDAWVRPRIDRSVALVTRDPDDGNLLPPGLPVVQAHGITRECLVAALGPIFGVTC